MEKYIEKYNNLYIYQTFEYSTIFIIDKNNV